MGFKLGKRSLERLEGVHPDIVRVVKRAIEITEIDFTVLEGVRTKEKQRHYVEIGASQTMNSKHLIQSDGYAHAVDLGAYVNGQVSWHWPLYHKIAAAMFKASNEFGVDLEWGGDWLSFPDGPHWQKAA